MSNQLAMPSDEDSTECHLQQTGMGTLVCRAARQRGQNSTNEVDHVICFNCEAGIIYREIGCNAVTPKIRIYQGGIGSRNRFHVEDLLCSIKKRSTSIEQCRKCNLISSESSRITISTTRGLFQQHKFYSAFQSIEKARFALRDGNTDSTITHSIACVESVMIITIERCGEQLPKKQTITDLWKCVRPILKLDIYDIPDVPQKLANALSGLATHLGSIRNHLSDAHGKGLSPPPVSHALAELAINTASTLSSLIIRRYIETKGE